MQRQDMFSGYLNPKVRDRLINYYANDQVFMNVQETIAIAQSLPDFAQRIEEVRELLTFKPTIEWYSQVSEQVFELVQREETIKDMADAISGQIVKDFFSKLSDLVGGHASLVWYSNPNVVSALSPLASRSDNIQQITDFVLSTTPGIGTPRWDMLQTYLGDAWYTGISQILSRKDNIMTLTGDTAGSTFTELVDLAGKHVGLSDLFDIRGGLDWYVRGVERGATIEAHMRDIISRKPGYDALDNMRGQIEGLVANKPTLDWYSDGNVVDRINGIISNGILPTIKERAIFNKGADFLERINQLGSIGDLAKNFIEKMDFSHPGYHFQYPQGFGGWFNWDGETATGITGFKDWIGDLRWFADNWSDYPIPRTREFIYHLMRGVNLMERMVGFIERLSKIVLEGGWR